MAISGRIQFCVAVILAKNGGDSNQRLLRRPTYCRRVNSQRRCPLNGRILRIPENVRDCDNTNPSAKWIPAGSMATVADPSAK